MTSLSGPPGDDAAAHAPVTPAEAQARCLYDAGANFDEIGKAWGCVGSTARRRAAKLWPPRRPKRAAARKRPARKKAAPPRKMPRRPAPRKAAAREAETPALDTRELARRVEASVRGELSAVEKRLSKSTAASAERNARTLASLVKSLAELRKLERDDEAHRRNERDGDEDTQPPVDMARLREKLADKLARLQAERETAISAGLDPE